MPLNINSNVVSKSNIQHETTTQTEAKIGDKSVKASETSSNATLLARSQDLPIMSQKELRRTQNTI